MPIGSKEDLNYPCQFTEKTSLTSQTGLGGGFKYFLFSPLPNIFQMGWFNHQLVVVLEDLGSLFWSLLLIGWLDEKRFFFCK